MSNLIHPMKNSEDQLDQNHEKDNNYPMELNVSIESNNNEMNSSCSENLQNQGINELYNMIKIQSDEIKLLLNQRESILSILYEYDGINSKSNDIIESMTNQINKLNQKNKVIENELNEIKGLEKNKNENLNDLYYSLLKKAPLEVLKKIKAKKHSQNQHSNQDISEDSNEILFLFDEICYQYSMFKQSNEREKNLVGHLKNALLFVNNFINSNSIQQKDINKALIKTQIARINHFIGENYEIDELQPVISLFQQNDPEKQIQAINSFMDKYDVENNEENKDDQVNEIASIPFNELYTLFYGVIEVNNLLFSQLDSVNKNISNTAPVISLRKQVFDLKEENNKLSDFYDKTNSKLDNISNLLSNSQIEQNSDIFDTISDLITKYNLICRKQDNDLVSPNESNSESTLDNKINNKDNEKEDSLLINDQHISSQQAIAMLTSQNQHIIDKINYFKIMVQKLKQTIAKEKKKFYNYENSAHAEINNLKFELAKIKKENLKKEKQKQDITSQLNELIKKNQELTKINKKLNNQSKKQQTQDEQPDLLQLKLRSINQENDQIQYSQIQIQTDDQNPDEKEETIQQKISSLENECSELKSYISSLTKSKDDILSQNIKFKISEKTLKLKVSQMEEFINYKDNQNKTQSQIREITSNTQKDLKIKDLIDQINNYEFLLKNFVESYFPNIEITKETKYPEIISKLEQAMMNTNLFFSQETLKDAEEIRKQSSLKKSDSILNQFNKIKTQLDKQSKTLKQLNDEKSMYSNEIKEAKSNIDKMNRYKTKLNEWNKWAVSVYTQVSGVICSVFSPSDIRRALEDILTSAINNRSLIGKLETLRAEKIFLNKHVNSNYVKLSKTQKNPTFSIKQLVFILLFTRNLQKLTSCLSISYIPCVINQSEEKKEETVSTDDTTI